MASKPHPRQYSSPQPKQLRQPASPACRCTAQTAPAGAVSSAECGTPPVATSTQTADGEVVHSSRQPRASPRYASSPTVVANQLRSAWLAVTVTCEVTPGGVGGGGGGAGTAGGEGGGGEPLLQSAGWVAQVSGHRSRR